MFAHRPLALYKSISLVTIFLLFSSFLLFLLVSLSLTIIKPIYLFSLRSTAPAPESAPLSLATELRFGIWGFCAYNALGDPPLCVGPSLGYTVPSYVAADVPGLTQPIIDVVQHVLLVILILHPITAAVSLLPLFFALFLASHPLTITALVLSVITALLASAALAIDIALVLVARSELKTLDSIHFAFDFGPAFWMILVATVLAWMALIALSARACYCLGVRR
ncbi:hypothetical protein CVT25_013561 [Psilocybe cyanescens]|uniref:Pali-domain-containing protein n=1 Tax=Psilocybe cyanescens TaxID=93625 RepID=A0A409XT21_PSICY|nr:hypothetical protein CVT25_013561 [Psilocybe cyanescens]